MGKIKLLKGNNSISIDRITINENFEHLHTDVDTIQSTITNKNIETVSNKVTNQSTVLGTTVTDALESLKNTVLIPGATGAQGATGADSTVQGPAGATGAAGATGSVGATGTSSASTIYTADGTLTGNRTVDLNGKNLTFQKLSTTTEYTKIYRNGGLEIRGSGFDTGNDVFKVKYRASGNDLLAVGQNGGVTIDSSISMGQFNSTWNYGQQFSDGYIKFYHGATWNDNEAIRFDLRNNTNATLTFNRNGQGTSGNRFIVRSSVLAESNHGTSKEQISLQGNTLIKGDTGTERTPYNFKVTDSNGLSTFEVLENRTTVIRGSGTSTSSALSIYDNDTTPVKLWGFLDNGNVSVTKSSSFLLSANKTLKVDGSSNTNQNIFELNGATNAFGTGAITVGAYGNLEIKGTDSTSNFKVLTMLGNDYLTLDGNGNQATLRTKAFDIGTSTTTGYKLSLDAGKHEFIRNTIMGANFDLVNSQVKFWEAGMTSRKFIVGGSSLIGTEKISLQGDTLLNANVNIPNLPTASTGLSSGDLWNDSGVVRVGTTVSNFLEKNTGTTYNTNNLMTVTQAEYDALTPDADTIYFIV
jgi:hypothetical protein